MTVRQWPVWRHVVIDNSVDIPKLYRHQVIMTDADVMEFWKLFPRNRGRFEKVNLALVTLDDLGFSSDFPSVLVSDLCERIREVGLRRVVKEVPYFLRLQYTDQPEGEKLEVLCQRFDNPDQDEMLTHEALWTPRLSRLEGALWLTSEAWYLTDLIGGQRSLIVQIP